MHVHDDWFQNSLLRPFSFHRYRKRNLFRIDGCWMPGCFFSSSPSPVLFAVPRSASANFNFRLVAARDNRSPLELWPRWRALGAWMSVLSISLSARKEEKKILSLAAGRPAIWTLSRSWDLHWKTCAPASARENLPGRQRRWHCGQDSWFSFPSGHYPPVLHLPPRRVHLPSVILTMHLPSVQSCPVRFFFRRSGLYNRQLSETVLVSMPVRIFTIWLSCLVSDPKLLQIKIVLILDFSVVLSFVRRKLVWIIISFIIVAIEWLDWSIPSTAITELII